MGKENTRLMEEKSALEHKLRVKEGVFDDSDPSNKIIKTHIKNRYDRLKNIKSNMSDVLKVASELISYIQNLDQSFEGVGNQIDVFVENTKSLAESSKASHVLREKLGSQTQEVQISLTNVVESSMETRKVAMEAALEAAKIGTEGHRFAELADRIKDLADESQLNAKRAKGSFGRFALSLDNEDIDQSGDVEALEAYGKSFKKAVDDVVSNDSGRSEKLEEMVAKANATLEKLSDELFLSETYITAYTGKVFVKSMNAAPDTNLGLCREQINKDAQQVMDMIPNAPISLEVMSRVLAQLEKDVNHAFEIIDAEMSTSEEEEYDALTIVKPLVEEPTVEEVAMDDLMEDVVQKKIS